MQQQVNDDDSFNYRFHLFLLFDCSSMPSHRRKAQGYAGQDSADGELGHFFVKWLFITIHDSICFSLRKNSVRGAPSHIGNRIPVEHIIVPVFMIDVVTFLETETALRG